MGIDTWFLASCRFWTPLRLGAVLVAVGTVLGFVGAIMMVKVLSALTNIFVESFRVATNDPLLLIGSPLLLAALAMLASFLPAGPQVGEDRSPEGAAGRVGHVLPLDELAS